MWSPSHLLRSLARPTQRADDIGLERSAAAFTEQHDGPLGSGRHVVPLEGAAAVPALVVIPPQNLESKPFSHSHYGDTSSVKSSARAVSTHEGESQSLSRRPARPSVL